MRKLLTVLAGATAALIAISPATASTVIDGKCVSVADSHGCLFDGNINNNASPANVNGYVNAQNAYNSYNDTHPSANPDIALSYITDTDAAGFGSFGSFTGAGTASGTWSLPGYLVDFIAVKASNKFVLYKITPASSGSWNTNDIPFQNNPHAISHIAFFGQLAPVPEPAMWAMLIGGFGMIGAAGRRRRARLATAL